MTSPILDFLTRLHGELAGCRDGEVATYIPELAKANPDWFGICVVTAGGHVYQVGDTGIEFTIQSISKPFVYGLALEDNGRGDVLAKVGVEPSGDAFNSISLEPDTGRPLNPMINAGAIATASLVPGVTATSRQRRLLHGFSAFAGRPLRIDETVYACESETGHRNRAIGHMLRNFDILTAAPEPTVELYFQQCSITVTCRDLGVMAATLANRGVNPLTGQQAVRGEYVADMLSVMSSCGMYDWAGEWIYKVGMPAKSGVAGGIVAVLPGQLGIGVFSPPLDSHGNSVRGIKVCEALSQRLDLHMFNRRGSRQGAIRVHFTGAKVSSRRVRNGSETATLQQHGHRIQVVQLQGNMTFGTTEALSHLVSERAGEIDYLILDFKHVLSINDTAARLVYELASQLQGAGRHVLFTRADRVPLLARVFRHKLGADFERHYISFEDEDPALEWCEAMVLAKHGAPAAEDTPPTLADIDLLSGLSREELEAFAARLDRREFAEHDLIIQVGDQADELFLLLEGRVSVFLGSENVQRRRLATFSPGMVFGEMSMIDRSPRSATIQADSAVVCQVLTREAFDRLGRDYPSIKIKLLENLSQALSRKLRKANIELSVFD